MSKSSSGLSGSETRTPITVEQVIGEAFVRAAQTILTSRISNPSSGPQQEKRKSTWVKLELEEFESASPALDRWRKDPGLPLIIEIYLQPWGSPARTPSSTAPTTTTTDTTAAALLERWVIHYRPSLPDATLTTAGLSATALARLSPQSVYKRLTIMLRSLYSYTRILPAYRLYRGSGGTAKGEAALTYKLHSTLPRSSAPALSGSGTGAKSSSSTASGGKRMLHFEFAPIDTAYGQLRVSVEAQPATTVTVLEQATAPVAFPRIINNYVGGPAQQQRRAQLPLRSAQSALPSPVEGGTPRRQSWSSGARWGSLRDRLQSVSSPSEGPSPRDGGEESYSFSNTSTPRHQQGQSMPRSLSTPPRSALPIPPRRPLIPPSPRLSPSPTTTSDEVAHSHPTQHMEGGPAKDLDIPDGCSRPQGGSPFDAAPPRHISAPVSIPRSSVPPQRADRRLRSSGDLAAMEAAGGGRKPLSAPAVSHMPLVRTEESVERLRGDDGNDDDDEATSPGLGMGQGRVRQVQQQQQRHPHFSPGTTPPTPAPATLPPPSPFPPIPCPGDSGTDDSAASSLAFPASCSPDLPFAFTPNGGGAASALILRSASSLSGSFPGGGTLDSPSRALSASALGGSHSYHVGRLARGMPPLPVPPAPLHRSTSGSSSTSLALVRRNPSLAASGTRSGSFYLGEGGASMRIGYSVSPMQEPGMDSVLAAATPRHMFYPGRLPSLTTSDSGEGGRVPPRLLTFPGGAAGTSPVGEAGQGGEGGVTPQPHQPGALLYEEQRRVSAARVETVRSPFELAPAPPRSRSAAAFDDFGDDVLGGGGGGVPYDEGHEVELEASMGGGSVSIGAFVKLLQEAPPLEGACGMSLQEGVERLEGLRQRLQARGVAC